MENLKIHTKTGWIISDVDKQKVKEVQYFDLPLAPALNTLMQASVRYYSIDGGLHWLKANSFGGKNIYDTKEIAQRAAEALHKTRQELGPGPDTSKLN